MKVHIDNQSDTLFLLTIEAGAQEMQSIKQATLKHLGSKHVKLPGFRAGKAPANLVEKNVDQNLLQSEFLEEAVNRLCLRAIQEEKLRPVAQPKITLKKFVPFTALEFTAELEAVGKIQLGNYKSTKTKPVVAQATAEDVKEVISGLQKRLAERQATDQPAKNGDEVIIDFKGKDNQGQAVSGADGQDYPLIIGSNTFIPGFEPNLVGLKTGDSKQFKVKFPADYGVAALQSKQVTFDVTVKTVNQIMEPKVDDAFAAKAGPFKTLAELKADIKKQLTLERQQQADRDYENALIKEISDKSKVSIPDSLVQEQVMQAEQREKQNLTYRGQTWEEHLKEEGVSEDEHRQRNAPDAEASVKAGIVLSEIAEQEGLQVTPEEVEIRLQILKGQYQDPAMLAELEKPENRQDIANRLLTEKTVAKLVEYNKKS
ncbi:MAG: trigger factor [Candidatus Saccharimonadales bacterium]